MDLSRPIVFGHEFVGRVIAYGPSSETRIPIGRRVVSMPVLPREQPVLLGFAGPEAPRAYAERMVLSEPLLIEVPDHVSTEVAALTEPLAVAYRTVARAELASNDVPLVVGCGPIGLAVIAVLKAKGVGPIVPPSSHRSRAAQRQRGTRRSR
jgi:threonine dehydrogenase-like Zn-dependent dehydrogenase